MRINYRNKRLEQVFVGVNALTAGFVAATFVLLFGFTEPLLPAWLLYLVQVVLLCVFIAEKWVRLLNAESRWEFLRGHWFEIPLLGALGVVVAGASRWFGQADSSTVRHVAVGVYLVVEVLIKVSRTTVNLAASGRNPTRTLIASFLVLIICGAGLLMLPRSSAAGRVGFVDAFFTATSATCVTGLVVKDTGGDFSLLGQLVILTLIQLGGLGIIVFGAVFALLLGQALTVRESVAMQDLLSARTVSRIGNQIAFIFVGTVVIESVGALSLFPMWNEAPGWIGGVRQQWFCSVFHSVSAFCNAGFSLFGDSFVGYQDNWGVYGVICPLIVLGGLGFGVLYNLANVFSDRVKRFFRRWLDRRCRISMEAPKRMELQTKIALSVSAVLIVGGALFILGFEHNDASEDVVGNPGFLGALFQSVTARTAGFNTVNISRLSAQSKFVLILLMFIGGSPGSAAGGIKTVTFAIVIMTAIAALRKRGEVEMFRRSVRLVVVGRAITVTLLFVLVLFSAALLLSVTERACGFTMSDIFFETASALGTVGLSTGITGSLTTVGKLIIIAVMLIGRLGPLTLLAALTFNLKPARYNYPEEALIVG